MSSSWLRCERPTLSAPAGRDQPSGAEVGEEQRPRYVKRSLGRTDCTLTLTRTHGPRTTAVSWLVVASTHTLTLPTEVEISTVALVRCSVCAKPSVPSGGSVTMLTWLG